MSIKETIELYNIAKKEFQDKLSNGFKTEIGNFFTKYPQIKGLMWEQYTPHFNDGESCKFSMSGIVALTSDETLAEAKDHNGASWDYEDGESPTVKEDLMELESVPHEIFLAMFGDHVQVVADREGFHVTEFQHD